MPPQNQPQFDGQNPVAGYTLFHGKDGKSYYLKGENLSDDEVTSRVAGIRSKQAVANGPPLTEQDAASGSYPVAQAHQGFTGTGEQGNYDATGRKVSGPRGESLTLMEKAAQDQADRQTKLGAAENRAARSPMAVTNASMAYFPGASARMLIGSKVGSTVGGDVGNQFSPEAQRYGELAGGFAGGMAGSIFAPDLRSTVARMVRNPVTGRVQSPWEIAIDKAFPDPYAPEAIPAKPIPRGTNYGQFLEDQKLTPKSKLPNRLPPNLRGDPFSPEVPSQAASLPSAPSVSVYPEPRTPLSEDRPGAMWSIPREELPTAAMRGQPGAVETMRNLGRPLVLTPRGFVGANNPEFMAVRDAAYNPFSPTPEEVNPSPFSPEPPKLRQEVNEMAIPSAASRVPEWQAGQVDAEITRLKGILRDPQATPEEQSVAASQLKSFTEQAPTKPHRYSNSAKTRQQIRDLSNQ